MAWLEKRKTFRICWREGKKVRRIPALNKEGVAVSDRQVAKQLLADFDKKRMRGESYADPFAAHRNRPLLDHLADWITELKQTGRGAIHVKQSQSRVARIAHECDWQFLADISAAKFIDWRPWRRSAAGA